MLTLNALNYSDYNRSVPMVSNIYFLFPINCPKPALICFSTSLAAASATAEVAAFCADFIPASMASWALFVNLLWAISRNVHENTFDVDTVKWGVSG